MFGGRVVDKSGFSPWQLGFEAVKGDKCTASLTCGVDLVAGYGGDAVVMNALL